MIIVFSFVLSLFLVDTAFCASLGAKKEQLYQARRNLKTVKHSLNIANKREKDLAIQLQKTQKQVRTLNFDITALSKNIARSKGDIRRLRIDLDNLQKQYNEKQAALQVRLRDIYLNDDNSFAQVIVGSEDFSDFINHTDYLSRVCESDQALISEIRRKQELINGKQRQINSKYRKMLSYRGYLKRKQESLENIEGRRKLLLSQVDRRRKYYTLRKYELEDHTYEIEKDVQKIIREYQRNRWAIPAYSTGIFAWPTNGTVTSDFGWRIHPIYGASRYHTGVDLGAGYGSPIRAADGGTVIYSSWCGGYGNTVMIDHGKGVVTLYGHCSSIYAGCGQSVEKGQAVAAVGSTGNSTGPHLHFEVRQNGIPVSPWGFLR